MNTAYFIAKRLSLKGSKSFSRLIVFISVFALTISLAVMILSLATVTGFQHGIKEKVTGFSGHLEVNNYTSNLNFDYPLFAHSDTLKDEIASIKGIKGVSKVLSKPGIIKTKENKEGIIVKGVDSSYHWEYLKKYIVKGRIPNLKYTAASEETIISAYTANKLNLKIDDKLRIYFIDHTVRAMAPKIVGIYNTGLEEYDKIFAIGNIKTLQRIFAAKADMVGNYEIQLEDLDASNEIQMEVEKLLPVELQCTTAEDRSPQIFDWLQLLDLNVYIVIILMLVVAAFNIVTALLILVLERVNMVGILKTLGEKDWNIRNIFIYKLAYINLWGLILGNVLGLGIALLQQKTGFLKLSQETYIVNEVMIKILPSHVLLVNAGTLIVSILSILLASKLVTSIQPSETVKFE